MIMEDVFNKLRSLQDVLSEKIKLEKEIEEIPRTLSSQEELLNRMKKNYIDKNTSYEETNAKIKDLRFKLQEAESSREHAEKAMDSISTQREYEALDKEIRDASDKEQSFRRELIREEKGFSEIEESLKREESMINQQEAELTEKRSKIEEDTNEKREELKKLIHEEKTLIPGLDEDVLFKFERIIRSKHGLGIVPVRMGVCSGCHMILPAQFVNEVRQGNKIIFCPYCSRILFYQEVEDDESSFLADIESGGLSDLDDFADEDDDTDYDDEDDDEGEKESIGFDED